MNREDNLATASRLLGRLVYEVKVKNAAGLFDINTIAEDFYVPILSKLFSCPALKNQNRIKANFPAVDLGCETSRISIQITSDPSSGKIAKTLELFRDHGLEKDFDELYVLVITEKQNSYTSSKLDEEIERLPVPFDSKVHIIDYHDLVKRLGEQSTGEIELIAAILEREFGKQDRHSKFHDELENFLTVAQSKIEYEKNTKKYIPSIFIETSSVKDNVRYFANPLFFYRRINESVADIDLLRLNMLLQLARQKPIEDANLPLMPSDVKSLAELGAGLAGQAEALLALRNRIIPFSMDRGDATPFEPEEDAKAYRRIWSYPIESNAYGINRAIGATLEAIQLTQAKIFLITSMAGQGKTNFVCDLVENQFRKFRLPSIFIPARDLNRYSGHDRIFEFIVDNRYAPDVRDLHELLKLFDDVARECGKPFIIVVDGINEVSAQVGFDTELNAFLDAVCQYDFVKALITCRSEFFERRFSSIMQQSFSSSVFRVENLRSQMTDSQKNRLIEAYFKHFRVGLTLSDQASNFLKNDLLLLRIFCESEEGSPNRFVSAIYKGELFERFLFLKVSAFEEKLQRRVVPTLHAIAARMLESGNFTILSTAGFHDQEVAVIERLIEEDVILRSEPTEATLASIGLQSISFTYDELRDFIISHYLVTDLSERAFADVEALFAQLEEMQIREGVFRYTYLLSRQHSKTDLVHLCERQADFTTQYVNNVDLIPPEQQTEADGNRVKEILASHKNADDVRATAVFLYYRRNQDEILNINILVDHINSLGDEECISFFRTLFSTRYGWREDWSARLTEVVLSFLEHAEASFPDRCPPLLTFMLQICGFSDWEHREAIFNRFATLLESRDTVDQLTQLRASRSHVIRRTAAEIWNVEDVQSA